MIIALLTIAAGYLIEAVLVGASLAWVLYVRRRPKFGPAGLVGVVVFFAFLDAYYIPAFLILDATITIGHPGFAKLLEADHPIPLAQLLSFGWLDLLFYVLQSIVALVAAQAILTRTRSAA